MADIKLDTSHDLLIEGKDISMFETIEDGTVQAVKIRLQNYQGNWFLDLNNGIPYYQEIFGYNDTKDLADTYIKTTIKNTDNITSITNYTSTLEDATLKVVFAAKTLVGADLTNITLFV